MFEDLGSKIVDQLYTRRDLGGGGLFLFCFPFLFREFPEARVLLAKLV